VPVLSFVAAHAQGLTVFRDVSELRAKESNRLGSIVEGLSVMGVDAWIEGDDLFIEGQPGLVLPEGLRFETHGDHRLAMTWALAGLCGAHPVELDDFDCVDVSFPGFMDSIRGLCA